MAKVILRQEAINDLSELGFGNIYYFKTHPMFARDRMNR